MLMITAENRNNVKPIDFNLKEQPKQQNCHKCKKCSSISNLSHREKELIN
jgi:hypothetical protein